jgi:hypothetical protein
MKSNLEHLATESPLISSPQRITWTLVLTLILVIAINLTTRFYLDRFTDKRSHWLIQRKWQLIEQQNTPIDWLILGDSSCNQGVDPRSLTKGLGGRALNLCTIGDSTLVGDLWQLERLINKAGAPHNIILVHVYDVWLRERISPFVLANIPLPWGFWSDSMGNYRPSLRESLEIAIERYFVLYAQNETIQSRMRSPLTLSKRRLFMTDDGFMPISVDNAEFVPLDANNHLAGLNGHFAIAEANAHAFRNLLGLAAKHGIQVYVLQSPIYDGLYSSSVYSRFMSTYLEELEQIVRPYKNVHVIDASCTFPANQMESVEHLVGKSADIYTEFVVSQIRAVMNVGEVRESGTHLSNSRGDGF